MPLALVGAILAVVIAAAHYQRLVRRHRWAWPPQIERVTVGAEGGPYRSATVLRERPGRPSLAARVATGTLLATGALASLWSVMVAALLYLSVAAMHAPADSIPGTVGEWTQWLGLVMARDPLFLDPTMHAVTVTICYGLLAMSLFGMATATQLFETAPALLARDPSAPGRLRGAIGWLTFLGVVSFAVLEVIFGAAGGLIDPFGAVSVAVLAVPVACLLAAMLLLLVSRWGHKRGCH